MAKHHTEADMAYPQLKKFFEFYVARYPPVPGLPPESHPVACLEMLEKVSASKARVGLRQAINDIIEMSLRLDPREVCEMDAELRTLGIVTLSQVRRESGRHFAKIVRQGEIKNATEYYLVRNMLDDRAEKSPEERRLLMKMVSEYERA